LVILTQLLDKSSTKSLPES